VIDAVLTRASGVDARLRLVFRARGAATYLAEQRAQAPLGIIRPFPQGDGSVLLQIVHVAPGLMGGDEYRLDVTVEPGARVVLTGTSATRVHPARPGGRAAQHIRFTVMDGGTLEYYPGLTIPFAGAEFVQTLDVVLAPGAKFGLLEQWAMGRIGRGECLAFRRLSSRTGIVMGGAPCYRDALELCPSETSPAGWGVLEGRRYVASGYWHWDAAPAQPDVVQDELLLVSGVPARGHRYLRCLAHDGVAMRGALRAFLTTQRAAWGLAPLPFERYTAL
jgi:urease accessory protein